MTLVLLAAVLVGVRAFSSHVFVAPFAKDQVLTGLALKDEPRPHEVFREWPESLPRRDESTALARILDSSVVRVCYRGSDYPSAFINSDGDLVGFDIEMAHRFARQLGARLAAGRDRGDPTAALVNSARRTRLARLMAVG